MRHVSLVSLLLLAAAALGPRECAAVNIAAIPTASAGVESSPSSATADGTYRRFEKSDCGGRDVRPQPSCGGNKNRSVAALEACCDSTRGCGGFNTHGVIKNAQCAQHIGAQPATDLYLRQACNTFKTKPSCPPPRCTWTAAASGGGNGTCARSLPPPQPFVAPPPVPWPLPNDAQMSTGSTTVQLSHDFTISREGGAACSTLDTAVQRYQQQAVGLHVARPQADGDAGPVLRKLLVQVADLDESYPQLNSSVSHESYELIIPADGSPATVTANTVWGAMWGMESFSQLVRFDFQTQLYR
jgi:hypothetical protein